MSTDTAFTDCDSTNIPKERQLNHYPHDRLLPPVPMRAWFLNFDMSKTTEESCCQRMQGLDLLEVEAEYTNSIEHRGSFNAKKLAGFEYGATPCIKPPARFSGRYEDLAVVPYQVRRVGMARIRRQSANKRLFSITMKQ